MLQDLIHVESPLKSNRRRKIRVNRVNSTTMTLPHSVVLRAIPRGASVRNDSEPDPADGTKDPLSY
jgi:hypothetical protein